MLALQADIYLRDRVQWWMTFQLIIDQSIDGPELERKIEVKTKSQIHNLLQGESTRRNLTQMMVSRNPHAQ